VEGDVPVGALTAGDRGGRGWVNEVGVRRGWQGRGIGAALLRRSFAEFSGRAFSRSC
jgi:GNAT superfamily N-acetyltransferase